MANNQLLENLVRLSSCTQKYMDEESIEKGEKCMKKVLRDYDSPCKFCILPKAWQNNEAPYDGGKFVHPVPLVFFNDSLMQAGLAATREKHLVDIMVVSRDPHCYYGDVLNINPEGHIEKAQSGERIVGVGEFIISLLGENYWQDFKSYLEEDSKAPTVYWTHLTKCNTNNRRNFAMRASTSCRKYLKEKIGFLNPRLIVGLGADVAKNLLPLECLSNTPLAIKTAEKFPGMGKILDLESGIIPDFQNTGLLILPHPAGANGWYGYWYDNPTKNQLCLKFLRRPGKPKIFWFNDWIEKAKRS